VEECGRCNRFFQAIRSPTVALFWRLRDCYHPTIILCSISSLLTGTLRAASNSHPIQGHFFGNRPCSRERLSLARLLIQKRPPTTRHLLLLFHKPFSLYRLQSSITSPMADQSTRSSAHLPRCKVGRPWLVVCRVARTPIHSLKPVAESH
jgi:hypothetical protein